MKNIIGKAYRFSLTVERSQPLRWNFGHLLGFDIYRKIEQMNRYAQCGDPIMVAEGNRDRWFIVDRFACYYGEVDCRGIAIVSEGEARVFVSTYELYILKQYYVIREFMSRSRLARRRLEKWRAFTEEQIRAFAPTLEDSDSETAELLLSYTPAR